VATGAAGTADDEGLGVLGALKVVAAVAGRFDLFWLVKPMPG
jgi:hypothetical protein